MWASCVIGDSKVADRKVTTDELAKRFIQFQLDNYTPEIRTHIGSLLQEFVNKFGTSPAEEIDRDEVVRWIEKHRGWKAANTKRMAFARLNRVFNWGVEKEFIQQNPLRAKRREGVPWKQGETPGFAPVSDEDFAGLLKEASPRFSRILRFLRLTGCTPMEARTLRWDMIDPWKRIMTIPPVGPGSKGSGVRIVPISKDVEEILREIQLNDKKNDGKGLVFTTRSGKGFGRQMLSGELRRAAMSARLKGLSLFGLGRASLYEKGLAKGLQPAEIAALAGLKHANVVTRRSMDRLKQDPQQLAELQRRLLSDGESPKE
jgi:integrase